MTHEIDEADPGAVVEGEAGGYDAAIRWVGAAVVFVRLEDDGSMLAVEAGGRWPLYSARVFAWESVAEVDIDGSEMPAVGVDAPGRFDRVAAVALIEASNGARGIGARDRQNFIIALRSARGGGGRIQVRRTPATRTEDINEVEL